MSGLVGEIVPIRRRCVRVGWCGRTRVYLPSTSYRFGFSRSGWGPRKTFVGLGSPSMDLGGVNANDVKVSCIDTLAVVQVVLGVMLDATTPDVASACYCGGTPLDVLDRTSNADPGGLRKNVTGESFSSHSPCPAPGGDQGGRLISHADMGPVEVQGTYFPRAKQHRPWRLGAVPVRGWDTVHCAPGLLPRRPLRSLLARGDISVS